MKKKIQKVPVSERALVQRINRKLRQLQPRSVLKKTKGARAKSDLGDFYILNTELNGIDKHHVDPETLGRELEVLSDSEEPEED